MSSIQERAKAELMLTNFEEADVQVLLTILRIFFRSWDSGGAVGCMIPVLTRLLEGKPLSPLTGDWDEWMDMSEANGGEPIWQNLRCSTVFKKPLGTDGATWAYDIDAPGQEHTQDWLPITFPYMPGESDPEPDMLLGRMDPSGERVGPAIDHDPPMDALELLTEHILELRRTCNSLAAQLEAEGAHTAAGDATIEEMRRKAWED